MLVEIKVIWFSYPACLTAVRHFVTLMSSNKCKRYNNDNNKSEEGVDKVSIFVCAGHCSSLGKFGRGRVIERTLQSKMSSFDAQSNFKIILAVSVKKSFAG